MNRGSAFVALAACAVVLSCAQEQAPVNRVQPNVSAKADFAGEWYYLQTVIDTPYGAGYTFVGEQGELEKITWEVQENYLIARRSYDFIAGSEDQGIGGDGTESGATIAMYRIESHFDIKFEYNTTTGERINVVSENTSDRPWNEREYMRVDWSSNLITDSNFLVAARLFDGIRSESVSYYVQDPDPNAPKFDHDEETGEMTYMDIVNKMFVEPQSVWLDGYGDIPVCWLTSTSYLDCTAGEITVRNSFLKVDPARDYQPFLYTGDRMEKFGYFVTERAGYDDHYGVVEPSRFRFANRHNIWLESHKKNEDGSLKTCTSDAQCDDGRGSVCDLDLARAYRTLENGRFQGACTIPYRDREIRPVAYFLSNSPDSATRAAEPRDYYFPEDLEPGAAHLVEGWNAAFKETVGSLRYNECLANLSDAGPADSAGEACEAEKNVADDVFVLCHSPVRETDSASCGAVGTAANIGDLRHSMIGWVSDAHLSSPLGYGPSAADPETGEIVMANAFVYGAALETLASQARDTVALLNGDIEISDLTSGDNVQGWIDSMIAPGSETTGNPADDHVIHIDGSDAERINAAMDFSWVRELTGGTYNEASRPQTPAQFVEALETARENIANGGGFGIGEGRGRARLQALRGTEIEHLLTTSDMRLAAGVDPRLPLSEGVFELASPLRGMSLDSLRALQAKRQLVHREACVLEADFADQGMLGLARAIKRAADSGEKSVEWYGKSYVIGTDDGALDYEAVRTMLRYPIFEAVTSHEVGHTLGLRHNFSGSYDSLNYKPGYWQLRDDGEMQPRAWDPMSEDEINGRIREFQYSTVMDYGNNFVVTDSEGIGHYDHAAIKMGYGDLVEVFADADDTAQLEWLNFIQGAGWPVNLKLDSFTSRGEVTAYTYTEIPALVGGVGKLEERADVPYTSLAESSYLRQIGLPGQLTSDAQGRPVVPYLFCSDEQADLGPDCQRYDAGADPYETLQSVIDTYWNYYIFAAFRRERLGFALDGYIDRVLHRYFDKLKHANQIYALYRGVFEDIFGDSSSFDEFWTRPDGMGAYTLGVGAGFNLLTRVVTAPEPGSYTEGERGDGTRAYVSGGGSVGGRSVNVGILDGRYLETTWNFDAGYYWFDQLERAGYMYDKILALEVLTDPNTSFLGRDTSADLRRYQISYYTSFGPSVSGFFRGLLGEDWSTIAPHAARDGSTSYPDALELAAGDMAGTPIDPAASFTIQLYAAVYGMAFIPDTFDQGFLDSSRICVQGGAECVDITGRETVEFTDPQTGLTYIAASYPTPDMKETGVGAQMLLHAKALTDNGSTGELRRFIDNLNIIRSLSWQLGFGG